MQIEETNTKISFARDQWDKKDWEIVKVSKWNHLPQIVQKDLWIENKVPSDATLEDLMKKRDGETYTPMLLKQSLRGNYVISSTMEFLDRMAPGLVIARAWGYDKDNQPELREHIEIILFDKGINIWYHYFVDGKQTWKLVAYFRTEIKSKTKYLIEAKIIEKYGDWALEVNINQSKFGALVPKISEDYYVGIVGCEGINRFYDFSKKILDEKDNWNVFP